MLSQHANDPSEIISLIYYFDGDTYDTPNLGL